MYLGPSDYLCGLSSGALLRVRPGQGPPRRLTGSLFTARRMREGVKSVWKSVSWISGRSTHESPNTPDGVTSANPAGQDPSSFSSSSSSFPREPVIALATVPCPSLSPLGVTTGAGGLVTVGGVVGGGRGSGASSSSSDTVPMPMHRVVSMSTEKLEVWDVVSRAGAG
ncbi:unnamed protein product, partial [Discosporangium mesarthrocarpum]